MNLLWMAAGLLLGLSIGAYLASVRRSLLQGEWEEAHQRLRALERNVQHRRFGILDMKTRIQEVDIDIADARSELNVLKSAYSQLNDALQDRWDRSLKYKSSINEQAKEIHRLEQEIDGWKDRLEKLKSEYDSGDITEKELKEELSRGISAICEHAAEELPAFQKLILELPIDEEQLTAESVNEIFGLVAAKIELLEGQVAYWQDKAVAQAPQSARQGPIKAPAKRAPAEDLIALHSPVQPAPHHGDK